VANLGDLAQRYTNDTFRSSWHRVMNLSQQPRFSVVCHGEMVV
jgi:isopenicillin N synthase-like dioxygenase